MLPIFGTAIKVISGFYLGCTGIVLSPYEVYVDRYVVDLRCEYTMRNTKIIEGFKVNLELKDFEITNMPRQ